MTSLTHSLDFVDERVEDIVDRSVQFQDSEILEDWEDLFRCSHIIRWQMSKTSMNRNLQRAEGKAT